MLKTFRYRIYPTKRQEEILNRHLALCCELYNAALQERREAWARERRCISWFDQNLQLKDVREQREDVREVNSTVLEGALHRVHLAFDGFFRRVKAGKSPGYPRFRSSRRYDSMTYRQVGKVLSESSVRLSKVGKVRIKLHRPLAGAIKTLTVKREAGRWFVLFVTDVNLCALPLSDLAVGCDMGISAFATFSDGSSITNPRHYETAQRKLRIAARRLSRKRNGSKRRGNAAQILQRAHQLVRNQRNDFHHKLSRAVVNAFGLIVVEDLNVRGLARSNLSKQINDAGWSGFINKLCAKAEEAARVVIKVNPSGTSQTCICGARVEKTLSQRWHLCSACGLSAPRDHVSAQIILARGLRVQALTSPVAECVA